jgi:hypothetical protein
MASVFYELKGSIFMTIVSIKLLTNGLLFSENNRQHQAQEQNVQVEKAIAYNCGDPCLIYWGGHPIYFAYHQTAD